MGIEIVSPRLAVPANSSRFFSSQDDSRRQPTGFVELAWDSQNPYLFNSAFDESMVRHDDCYCTTVVDLDRVTQLQSMAYFDQVINLLPASAKIIDIGCGQGEFVDALRGRGLDAFGFDPVLRRTSPFLYPRYWKPGCEERADVYVMRCVLPHIPDPWSFLSSIARSSPGCLVLIEFQRLEWIIGQQNWYQVSHDHVNLFSLRDFSERYRVAAQGEFGNGEWSWVLLDPSTYVSVRPRYFDLASEVRNLWLDRESALENIVALDRPIAVWGGAGKGIVLGHALREAGAGSLVAIDADRNRWNLYLEASGIRVLSPDRARAELPSDTLVLVCNPNHLAEIEGRVNARWELALPRDFV